MIWKDDNASAPCQAASSAVCETKPAFDEDLASACPWDGSFGGGPAASDEASALKIESVRAPKAHTIWRDVVRRRGRMRLPRLEGDSRGVVLVSGRRTDASRAKSARVAKLAGVGKRKHAGNALGKRNIEHAQ